MVALDAIEQMHAKAFKLVDANTGKNSGTGESKISRDFARVESAHVKIGRIAFCKERFSTAGNTERGGQPMRPASQRGERIRSFGEVTRLVQKTPLW